MQIQKSEKNFFSKIMMVLVGIVLISLIVLAAYNRHAADTAKAAMQEQQAELEQTQKELEQLQTDYRQKEAELQAMLEEQSGKLILKVDGDFSAEPPAYQSKYPDFYAPQTLQATERGENVIHLTFDDGPTAYTDDILNTLKEKDVKATFYVVGKGHTDAKSLARMKRIVAEGHSIGMHSYSHQYTQIYSSVEAYLDDMYQVFTLIKETTGVTPTLFRFPGGSINSYNKGVYQELIAEMLRRGFVPCDWNLSNGDAEGKKYTEEQMIRRVVEPAAVRSRGIVLMHDTKEKTAKALGPMIDQLKDLGFSFEPLTEKTAPILYDYPS